MKAELDWLDTWIDCARPMLLRADAEVAELYSDAQQLAHHREVARRLLERFGDRALAQAGFLHSCPPSALRSFGNRRDIEIPELEFDALHLLDRYASLKTLKPQPEVEDRLTRDILPATDPRAVVLLVFDHLHRLDPTGTVEDWSRRFHENPDAPPSSFASGPQCDPLLSDSNSDFLRRIVCPAGEYLGLFHEWTLLEDAVLVLNEPSRADALVGFTKRMREEVCEGVLEEIAHRAPSLVEGAEHRLRWEWRHAGSLNAQLRDVREEQWKRRVGDLGYVCLLASQEIDCYAIVGLLHKHFAHRRDAFRDYVGTPTPAGYRAIHTRILLENARAGLPAEVVVKIIPEEFEEKRFLPSEGWRALAAPIDTEGFATRLSMPVFAADGQRFDLPLGATVLEFASRIHDDLVVQVKGARINRVDVGLFHRLTPGNVVYLDVSGPPRPLPADWEERITEEASMARIRDAFRRAYRPVLRERGYQYLSEQLVRRDLPELPSREAMTELIEAIHAPLPEQLHDPASVDGKWWLQQLGILEARLRAEKLPHTLEIDEAAADRLVGLLERRIKHDRIRQEFGLQFVERGTFRLESCQICRPTAEDFVVEPRIGGLVVLHRPAAVCAQRAQPVSWLARYSPQHFWIEGRERAGLAEDVAGVFTSENIGMAEIIGLRLTHSQSTLRIRIDPVSRATADRLLERLRAIEGVDRVLGPQDGVSTLEADAFPPRSVTTDTFLDFRPSPYPLGEQIRSDTQFYGRTTARSELRRLFDNSVASEQHAGQLAFVQGPLKIGKTSVVLAFQRELNRERHGRCLTVHVEAGLEEPWSQFAPKLNRILLDRALELPGADPLALPRSLAPKAPELVLQAIQETLRVPVVLAIDEVVSLFTHSNGAPDKRPLLRFLDYVKHRPGVLTLLIGPVAPVYRLQSQEFSHLLRSIRPVRIGSMPEHEMDPLIRAEKSGHAIEAAPHVTRKIHRLTGGNPHWANMIADRMLTLQPGGKELRRYTASLVTQAKQDLLTDENVFSARYRRDSRNANEEVLTWVVLREAATAYLEGGVEGSAVPLEQMVEAAGMLAARTSPETILSIAEELESMGALIPIHREPGTIWWRISAPLLAEHVVSARTGLRHHLKELEAK